jgi:predicted RNA methylase
MKPEMFLDQVMERIYVETGAYPYNAEDVCCDFIRWVENYVRPGADYNHVDRDQIFSSCKILDHPFGRQKAMLDLKLIDSFNRLTAHPSDDYVLKIHNMSVEQYKELCKTL